MESAGVDGGGPGVVARGVDLLGMTDRPRGWTKAPRTSSYSAYPALPPRKPAPGRSRPHPHEADMPKAATKKTAAKQPQSISGDAVEKATGKRWDEWFRLLDKA